MGKDLDSLGWTSTLIAVTFFVTYIWHDIFSDYSAPLLLAVSVVMYVIYVIFYPRNMAVFSSLCLTMLATLMASKPSSFHLFPVLCLPVVVANIIANNQSANPINTFGLIILILLLPLTLVGILSFSNIWITFPIALSTPLLYFLAKDAAKENPNFLRKNKEKGIEGKVDT